MGFADADARRAADRRLALGAGAVAALAGGARARSRRCCRCCCARSPHGPDPAHALNRFSDIVERLSSGVNLYRLLEAQPRLAEMLSLILAHAPALADQLARRPALLDGLIDASSFAEPPDAATRCRATGRRRRRRKL